MTTTVKTTRAQESALECAGVVEDFDGTLDALKAAWTPGRISFSAGTRDAVCAALIECANAEDYTAEHSSDVTLRRFARNARAALSNLASKIARL